MFSIQESFRSGWQKFKSHIELSLLTTLLLLALGSLVGRGGEHRGAFILGLAMTVFLIILRIGYTKIFLRLHDGESPKFLEIFQEYKPFWKYLGVSILYPLVVFAGLILVIIPGIFWAVRFSLSPIILIDMRVGPIKAMRDSWALTRGKFWKLLGFWIVTAILNVLGFVIFGIGLLVTIPVSTLAAIYVYRELSKRLAPTTEGLTPVSTSI